MSRVAIRYSKALFELALEQNFMEDVRDDLVRIKDVCQTNPEFQQTLNNPLIDEKIKSTILGKLFGANLNQLTSKFIQLLSRKKRSGHLLEIIENYLQRVLDHQDIVSCLLISSRQLDTNQSEMIKSRVEVLTGKRVILTSHIDDYILGGFIVRIKDTVIDLSIKTQLDKLRNRLMVR